MTKGGWLVPPVVIPLGLVLACLSYLVFLYFNEF